LFIKLPREQKLEIAGKMQRYLNTEFSEEIGQLATEIFLDFILKEISPYIYNQAIKDARSIIEQRMILLEEDICALEIPILPARREQGDI
jgi:uncharacterized protein (DUF2164 family)